MWIGISLWKFYFRLRSYQRNRKQIPVPCVGFAWALQRKTEMGYLKSLFLVLTVGTAVRWNDILVNFIYVFLLVIFVLPSFMLSIESLSFGTSILWKTMILPPFTAQIARPNFIVILFYRSPNMPQVFTRTDRKDPVREMAMHWMQSLFSLHICRQCGM